MSELQTMSDAPEGNIHYVVTDAAGVVQSAGIAAPESWPALRKVCGGQVVSAEEHTRLKTGRFLYCDGEITVKPADPAEVAYGVIAMRNRLLVASDWSQAADIPHTPEAAVQWRDYRQALRDVPAQAGFPLTIDWPARPSTPQRIP